MGAADRRRGSVVRRKATAGGRLAPLVPFAVLVALLAARRADALVSCANPDTLCRGNPCVTGNVEVQSPCVVDFGDRRLVIGGALKVPNGGVLSLTAGSIDVRRPILGRHSKQSQGDGADITLTAARDVVVRWRIDASARKHAGAIHLQAGGNVQLLAPVRAGATGLNPRASGGTVTIEAGGTITGVHRARLRVHGDTATPGGSAVLKAGRGIHLAGRITATGSTGGSIDLTTTAGAVFLEEPMDASAEAGDGGSVSIVAADGAVTLLDRVDVEGDGHGGSIEIIGGQSVATNAELRAGSRVRASDGGAVVVSSNANVTVGDTVYADGKNGGRVTVVSQSETARVQAPLVLGGNRASGGTALLIGGKNIIVDSTVDADGFTLGGTITIAATDVNLTSHTALYARGDTGGTITVSGDMVRVVAGANVLVDGDQPGGTIVLQANAGDLILDGDFRARGRMGGRIEGTASGDVVASGNFIARGSGCIAFSAGSMLDVSGGAFDVPITSQCP
jgi:hypothetical protein